jgi:hypothetical protein
MAVNRDSFTVGTEVGIMTYSTLITIANNVATVAFALAEWPIAVDAIMNLGLRWCIRDWFVDRGESVARMDMLRALDAGRAIIPVRASQAFVANANDVLRRIRIVQFSKYKPSVPYHTHHRWHGGVFHVLPCKSQGQAPRSWYPPREV